MYSLHEFPLCDSGNSVCTTAKYCLQYALIAKYATLHVVPLFCSVALVLYR